MSDYRPTTDEVRRDHLRAGSIPHFDRWYAAEKTRWQSAALRQAAGLLSARGYEEAAGTLIGHSLAMEEE